MQDYVSFVKNSLTQTLRDMEKVSYLFVKNPICDFSRKRKLDFVSFFDFFLSMEGKTLALELLEHFDYSVEAPSNSAFNQQRSKILPEAFEYLFHTFSDTVLKSKTWKNYRILACDGSDLNIPRNPNDANTYYQSTPNDKGFNQLHLNALYDICGRSYVDALIQDRTEENEFRACIQMIERTKINNHNVILIADRGYENYNLFAHAQEKNWKYAIRAKDIHSNGILSGLVNLPEGCFDTEISLQLTRRQTNEIKKHPEKYKFMPSCQIFDFLPVGNKGTYEINFRVVRFLIGDNSYESIITNISSDEMNPYEIKELYHMRWGIETSFRELKYAIGLTNFHSKKVEYIKQEIYARLTLYNFCEAITTSIILKKHNQQTKHCYQVNYTMAISICKKYLKKNGIVPTQVVALIQKYTLPIRPGRQDPRKVNPQAAIGFLYRVA